MKQLLLLTLLLISYSIVAQIDHNYWFVAPDVAQGHGDRPIYLHISTINEGGDVIISQPANELFDPITATIPNGGMVTVDLTSRINMIENTPPDQVLNYGLYLTSDIIFSVYYEVAHSNNPDIYPLKGRNALGVDFWIPGQNDWPNIYGNEVIDIVATEANTTVTITPTIAVEGHPANLPYTITLNRGETYSCRAINTTAAFTLAGTHISADKSIAITISDDSVGPSSNYDLLGDQMVPTELLDTAYIVLRGNAFVGSTNYEKAFVLATEDNTDIFVNNSLLPVAQLNQGEQYVHNLTDNAAFITSTKPVCIYHLSGIENEFGSAILPPIACTGSKEISFVRSSNLEFDMFLFTETANTDHFLLNGSSLIITSGMFSTVPGTIGLLSYTRMITVPTADVPVGNNILFNSSGKFHLGILNELGGSSEYGFFSGFASLNLGPDVFECTEEGTLLDAGEFVDSYLWNTGATTQTINASDSGTYWIDVVDDLCNLSDTIYFGWYEVVHSQLQPDIETCEGSTTFLDAGPDFESYLWSTGEQTQTIETATIGEVRVTVTEPANSCSTTDTTNITLLPRPAPKSIKSKKF